MTTNVTGDQEPRTAGRKEWIAFSVLMLPLLLVSMDVSVLYFAVPFISQDLEPSSTQQLWIFDIYGFVLAGLLITMGSLGDRIGRRKLLMLGAAGFGLASAAAAFAQNAEMLIAARALLGIGGATLMPSTLALVRNMFHNEKQRSKAVGIWTGVMAGGVGLGPVLSGALLEYFSWGSVFLVNIPFMVMLLVLGPLLVPEFKASDPGRFDLLGALLSLGAVLPVIYGIKEMAKDGFSPEMSLAVLVGLGVGLLFVRRQLTLESPMLDLTMFRNRGFSGPIVMNMLAMFAMVGFAIFTTQYLQSVLGMSPLRAALWSLLPSVGVGGVAPLATALGQKVDRAFVAAGGFVVAVAGFGVLLLVTADTAMWIALVGCTIYAMGIMAVMATAGEMIMAVVPAERAGSAAATVEMGSELGGALGMAILGSIGGAVYGSSIALPGGLSAEDTGIAKETLGGAQAVSSGIGGDLGRQVLEAARSAFVDGMHAAAIGGMALMAVAAAVTLMTMRGVRTGAPKEPELEKAA